jgi:hypothetical protein
MGKPPIRKYSGTFLLSVLLLCQWNTASAQEGLSDSQIREKLQAIRQMLERGKPNVDRWWTGWLIGYSAATVGQGAVCLINKDKGIRQDMALGAATTCLGALGQIMENACDRRHGQSRRGDRGMAGF